MGSAAPPTEGPRPHRPYPRSAQAPSPSRAGAHAAVRSAPPPAPWLLTEIRHDWPAVLTAPRKSAATAPGPGSLCSAAARCESVVELSLGGHSESAAGSQRRSGVLAGSRPLSLMTERLRTAPRPQPSADAVLQPRDPLPSHEVPSYHATRWASCARLIGAWDGPIAVLLAGVHAA